MIKLPRSFYDRHTALVARELLGKWLVRDDNGIRRVGKIVETEAYLGEHDLAAHSAKGRTARTEIMFGPPGHAYVYFVYGMHFCLNVVTEPAGHASAVLLRALEPVENLGGRTCGPALLCRALQINKRFNGHDLLSKDLFIAEPEAAGKLVIAKSPRIGVEYARHWARRHLRFYIKGNPFVSR
jgi:DNA-3-methyladenine glycosylase